jgi:carbamoyl-phosphate synthase small subunit
MRHRERPIFSVQYHPEASPGPHDAVSLFDRFLDLLEER